MPAEPRTPRTPRPAAAPRRRRPHAERVRFRPSFLLVVLYVGVLTVAFALAFALPDLLRAAAELPPGPAGLGEAELARARDVARGALDGARLAVAFVAAAAVVGAGIWARLLPGFRGG